MTKKQIEQIKKSIEEKETIKDDNINKTLDQYNEDINNKLDNKINTLEKNIKNSLKNISINKNNKLEKEKSKELINNEGQNTDKDNNNNLIGMKKSIKEINKTIKDFEQLKSDISALKTGMKNYVLSLEFKEFKEIAEDNSINLIKLKEEFEDFRITQNNNTEITKINLKLESVWNKVHDILNNMNKKGNKNSYISNPDDKYNFLEYTIFEEFKSHIIKEFSNINNNFNNSKKLLDELIQLVRNRTSFKDLKILEEAILSQIEDLKITFSKKFADKNEVNRGMKYLDQQLKNIIQIYIKKIDKGDNWLLSKKPLSHNLCASCESYLGDIKNINDNNNIYIPWSKYPIKDSNDKLYRMGNGYSKMLQLIQLDEDDKKREHINNIINMNKTESNGFDIKGKKEKILKNLKRISPKSLPKLKYKKMNKKANSTFSGNDNININIDSDEGDEEPTINKVLKVNKE